MKEQSEESINGRGLDLLEEAGIKVSDEERTLAEAVGDGDSMVDTIKKAANELGFDVMNIKGGSPEELLNKLMEVIADGRAGYREADPKRVAMTLSSQKKALANFEELMYNDPNIESEEDREFCRNIAKLARELQALVPKAAFSNMLFTYMANCFGILISPPPLIDKIIKIMFNEHRRMFEGGHHE